MHASVRWQGASQGTSMTERDRIWQARRASTLTFALVRMAVGALFLAHGWQKLVDVTGTVAAFTQLGVPLPALSVYVAILAECVGGLGLLLGAFTEFAAWGPLVSTTAAIFFVHSGHGLFPRNGGWELPLILLLVCFHLAARGGGAYSLDARMRARGRPRFRRRHRHVAVQT